jgi:hypothetical protein
MLKLAYWTMLFAISSLFGIAHAVPIRYTMNFDGAVAGPAGVGEFIWDSETFTMTNLSWQFDEYRGFVSDEDLGASLGPSNLGHFVYDVLVKTGEQDPIFGGIPTITSFLSIGGGFPQPFARFMTINRRCYPEEITSGPFYFFGNGISEPCNIAPYRGVVTTSAVAEPESFALFALGCLSLLLMAMRRRSWISARRH